MEDLRLKNLELLLDVQRCKDLLDSNIFASNSLFTQSAFIETVIRLNYILQELSRNGLRIAWADDLQKNKGVKDITDLLNTIRNAACHLDSPKNYLEDTKTKFVFNTFFGKKHNALEIGQNVFLGCDFEDDVGFYYGENRIYLRRHIVRLLQELPKEINKLQV